MENFGSMLKSALVVIVLVAVFQSGSAAEKLSECCKKVSNQEITEPILGYLVQKADPPCVKAVIFQTKSGYYCSQLSAPWVRRKVVAFEEAKARAAALAVVPPSPTSLLSIITSTASPPSSSSLPSSSSSSETPAGETFSEKHDE